VLLEPMHVGLGVCSRARAHRVLATLGVHPFWVNALHGLGVVSLGHLLYIRPKLPNLGSRSFFFYYFGGFFCSILRAFLGHFIWNHYKQIIFGII
jgi:hypothetical protein